MQVVKDGIRCAYYQKRIPVGLVGPIRDDGPLPEVITESILAPDAMRELAVRATLVIMIADVLHSVATGNLLTVITQ